jgi:murein DD-endopeptidase MepM/ murein hydrolase activator NlpD
LAGKKWAKFITAAVLAMVLLVTPQIMPSTPASATSLSALQQKQAQLKKQQAELAAKIKSLKSDKAKQQELKAAYDNQRTTIQGQIDVLNQQIAALDDDITQKESQIAAKEASISSNFARLKDRLHAMYLTGEASNLEIVLSAKNIMDLSDKTEAIKAITTHDTQLIDTLKADMASIKTQKAAIEENRKNVSAARTALDTKHKELSDLAAETQSVITQIAADESSAEKENAKLAVERKKADAAIDQWYKDYYASHRSPSDSGGYISKGNFTWPTPGITRITSYWGDGRGHKGLDIASSGCYGKPIVAADSGKVIMAGWGNYGTGYGGYGNVVAINHGGGYSTLYGHCSSVAVSTGQFVQKGQVIAYIGSSGQSTGAHLHFEIRVNGVAQNPLNWFSRA